MYVRIFHNDFKRKIYSKSEDFIKIWIYWIISPLTRMIKSWFMKFCAWESKKKACAFNCNKIHIYEFQSAR